MPQAALPFHARKRLSSLGVAVGVVCFGMLLGLGIVSSGGGHVPGEQDVRTVLRAYTDNDFAFLGCRENGNERACRASYRITPGSTSRVHVEDVIFLKEGDKWRYEAVQSALVDSSASGAGAR